MKLENPASEIREKRYPHFPFLLTLIVFLMSLLSCFCVCVCNLFFFNFFFFFFFFLAVFGLHCCMGFSLVAASRGAQDSLVAMHRVVIAVTSLVEQGL